MKETVTVVGLTRIVIMFNKKKFYVGRTPNGRYRPNQKDDNIRTKSKLSRTNVLKMITYLCPRFRLTNI